MKIHSSPGQEVKIELKENPSTGYRWNLTNLPVSVELLGDAFVLSSQRPGAAGIRIFRLVPTTTGTFLFELELRREWETEALERSVIELTVECNPLPP
jgi:inhibitor of cysteine peptidase